MLNYSERQRLSSLELATRSEILVSFESIVSILVTIFALIGNLLVCIAIIKNRSLRTRQNVYIVNLAISDIAMAMFVMPLSVGVLITGRWPYGKASCHMQGFVGVVAGMVSVETMTLIAVHRYFKVVHPRLYDKIFKKSSVATSVAISWVLALVTQTQHVAMFDYIFHPGKACCFFGFNWEGFSIFLIMSAFLLQAPFLIIAFCYYKVHRKVREHENRSFRNKTVVNRAKSATEIKVNRLLFVLVISFTFCWVIPVNAVDLSEFYFGQFSLPKALYRAYSCLIALSSTINPIIYNALSREFRTAFKRLVACGHVRRSRRVNQIKVDAIAPQRFASREKTRPLEICIEPKLE